MRGRAVVKTKADVDVRIMLPATGHLACSSKPNPYPGRAFISYDSLHMSDHSIRWAQSANDP